MSEKNTDIRAIIIWSCIPSWRQLLFKKKMRKIYSKFSSLLLLPTTTNFLYNVLSDLHHRMNNLHNRRNPK